MEIVLVEIADAPRRPALIILRCCKACSPSALSSSEEDIDKAFEHLKQRSRNSVCQALVARALGEVGRGDLAVIQVGEYLRSSVHDCERRVGSLVASVQSRLQSDK
jgi:hypothetical protein